MINLFKKEDLKLLLKYPNEVVENIENVIDILDENYGCNRKLTDDGGYICIIEDIKEIEYLKVNILKGLVEEFSDVVYQDDIFSDRILRKLFVLKYAPNGMWMKLQISY